MYHVRVYGYFNMVLTSIIYKRINPTKPTTKHLLPELELGGDIDRSYLVLPELGACLAPGLTDTPSPRNPSPSPFTFS